MGEHLGAHAEAGAVADDFEREAAEHAIEVAPGVVMDAEEELGDEEKSEDGGVEGIAEKRRHVGRVG